MAKLEFWASPMACRPFFGHSLVMLVYPDYLNNLSESEQNVVNDPSFQENKTFGNYSKSELK